MKKIFSIVAVSLMSLILIFIACLCFIKKNVPIEYGTPETIYIYNKSTSPTSTFTASDKEFEETLSELKNITNMSLFNHLIKLNTLNTTVVQDMESKYAKWETSMKQSSIVVELYFGPKMQHSVVYHNGNSKVVSYYYLSYVIPTDGNFNEIAVYFCDTTDSTSSTKDKNYQGHKPLIISGFTKNIFNFVNSL